MQLGLSHPSNANIPWCECTYPIDLMGIHLLCCAHGNEHIGTHDAICNTFVIIVRNVGFHMGWKQLHALLSTTFNSFYRQVDIVFTKYDILTLADVVIADPMRVDLLPRSCVTQGFCFRCSSDQRKKLLQSTLQWSIPPLNNWSIWLLTKTCQCVYAQLCQCHLELEGDKSTSSFYLGHFSL
jgi:hypothetical protein